MDLKIGIQQDLWDVIEKNYVNESYSSAILDTIHLLTETIRNKTGLEGDGSSLIGQAFGGENPKIQLNKLQTESEKNVQKGMQDILRGVFTAIRNPRSHDKHTDTKADADAIIYFIDYLLKIIDNSKMSFEETTFLNRVFEKYYVKTVEYSDLLVAEIPKRQRVNIAIAVILKRNNGDIYKLAYFFAALISKLEENEINQVYKVISEELKYTDTHNDISTILHISPPNNWYRIDKLVRLRIENLLYENVKLGEYDPEEENCKHGALGTWIEKDHLLHFDKPYQWTLLIVEKLKKVNSNEKEYAKQYFLEKITRLNYENIYYPLLKYISNGLMNDDEEIIQLVDSEIHHSKEHPWWTIFEEELKRHPDIKYIDYSFLE
jgi:uncharacterized protein (TIGR02391 family)